MEGVYQYLFAGFREGAKQRNALSSPSRRCPSLTTLASATGAAMPPPRHFHTRCSLALYSYDDDDDRLILCGVGDAG